MSHHTSTHAAMVTLPLINSLLCPQTPDPNGHVAGKRFNKACIVVREHSRQRPMPVMVYGCMTVHSTGIGSLIRLCRRNAEPASHNVAERHDDRCSCILQVSGHEASKAIFARSVPQLKLDPFVPAEDLGPRQAFA